MSAWHLWLTGHLHAHRTKLLGPGWRILVCYVQSELYTHDLPTRFTYIHTHRHPHTHKRTYTHVCTHTQIVAMRISGWLGNGKSCELKGSLTWCNFLQFSCNIVQTGYATISLIFAQCEVVSCNMRLSHRSMEFWTCSKYSIMWHRIIHNPVIAACDPHRSVSWTVVSYLTQVTRLAAHARLWVPLVHTQQTWWRSCRKADWYMGGAASSLYNLKGIMRNPLHLSLWLKVKNGSISPESLIFILFVCVERKGVAKTPLYFIYGCLLTSTWASGGRARVHIRTYEHTYEAAFKLTYLSFMIVMWLHSWYMFSWYGYSVFEIKVLLWEYKLFIILILNISQLVLICSSFYKKHGPSRCKSTIVTGSNTIVTGSNKRKQKLQYRSILVLVGKTIRIFAQRVRTVQVLVVGPETVL